jgi:EmrB/QacA subfamily drug resistance transporter
MQLQSQLARPRVRPQASPALVLVIVCAGVVLASLDLFIVNVALPQIARDLHTSSLSNLSWVLNGYAIVYASLLVFFGRLADRYRRDRGFLLGAAVFTLSSAACAAATSVGMLIGFRLVQAAGAALLTPTSLSLILASYEPERRSGAVRVWTATGGLAAALGPVVGGLLVTASWRWVFLVNVPIGVAAIVAGWRLLPAVPGHEIERPDPLGVILATGGVGLLTFGLVKGGDWGWGSAAIAGVLAGAAVLIALFAVHTMKSRTPLVQPSLFRSRAFTSASLVCLFFSCAFGAMLLSIVLWEQDVWGWSALRAGLGIALMVPLLGLAVAGRLIKRYGPAPVMIAGCAVFGAGVCCWATLATVRPDYWPGMVVGMLLTGAGVGLALPTMMATAASSLPPSSFGTGSAVVNMIRQTGIALGVAVLVAVLGAHAGLAAFREGWWVTAGFAFAGIVPAVVLLARPSMPLAPTAPLERADGANGSFVTGGHG